MGDSSASYIHMVSTHLSPSLISDFFSYITEWVSNVVDAMMTMNTHDLYAGATPDRGVHPLQYEQRRMHGSPFQTCWHQASHHLHRSAITFSQTPWIHIYKIIFLYIRTYAYSALNKCITMYVCIIHLWGDCSVEGIGESEQGVLRVLRKEQRGKKVWADKSGGKWWSPEQPLGCF